MEPGVGFTEMLFGAIKVVIVIAAAYGIHRFINGRLNQRPGSHYRGQLVTLAIVLLSIVLVLVVLPIDHNLRGQLLSLTGILITAVIALSSTTYVGNVMAGAMLRSIKNCRPGDYVQIADYFGRISEMDLLHIEIQTEERDLVTLPNLFMVTNPMRVLRNSGTLVSVSLSLGYDVSRKVIEKQLIVAAKNAKLEKPFVQITDLGDYSVTYRVKGLLTDLSKLLATRRLLRACVLDQLHGANIEIVSPTFMNQRVFPKESQFVPAKVFDNSQEVQTPSPDAVVFDKAAKAETLESLRAQLDEVAESIGALEEKIKETDRPEVIQELKERIGNLTEKGERWKKLIEAREIKLKNDE